MILDLKDKSKTEIYFTFIQTLVPRPVAWVLSPHANGAFNLAPFSYFSGVCSEPPIVSLSVGRQRDGVLKDTWTNLEERKDCVIHIPHSKQAEAVTASAATYDNKTSEAAELDLETVEVEGWPLPRLKDCRIAYLGEHFATHKIGDPGQGLILVKINAVYIDDSVAILDGKGLKVDTGALDPLARLGGDDYGTIGEVFTIARPK